MENAKNYMNLKHLGFPNGCQTLFKEEPLDMNMNEVKPVKNESSNNEIFSRKVFVGGLPPDIDETSITSFFLHFGPVSVFWPHKAVSGAFPPKGYAFLIFDNENSVVNLLQNCCTEDGKHYIQLSSPSIMNKFVQVRPWTLSDSDHVLDASLTMDPRLTVFVGGVPRTLKAVELALIMENQYKGVCYAGIDTDHDLKYPKGAGRVAFSNRESYIAALSTRYLQLQYGDVDKRIEVKPFVLAGQLCDECQGNRCNGQVASYFCGHVNCLQYFCDPCWATVHCRPGFGFHKPLIKEGGVRPRSVSYRWC